MFLEEWIAAGGNETRIETRSSPNSHECRARPARNAPDQNREAGQTLPSAYREMQWAVPQLAGRRSFLVGALTISHCRFQMKRHRSDLQFVLCNRFTNSIEKVNLRSRRSAAGPTVYTQLGRFRQKSWSTFSTCSNHQETGTLKTYPTSFLDSYRKLHDSQRIDIGPGIGRQRLHQDSFRCRAWSDKHPP